jgi:hypothetical protein
MEQKVRKAREGSADVFMTKPQTLGRRLIIPAAKNTAALPPRKVYNGISLTISHLIN